MFETAIKVNVGVDSKNIVLILGVQLSNNFGPNSSSKSNRGSV